ncbi:MAG: ATP-binding protein [candidate division WOR-3 bacterium]
MAAGKASPRSEKEAIERPPDETRELDLLRRSCARLANELRQPIATIRNAAYFSRTHLSDSLDPRVRRHLALIWQTTEAVAHRLLDILALLKEDHPDRVLISSSALADGALARVQIPQQIRVSLLLDRLLPKVLVDPQHIIHALAAVIANAVEAMPDGGELRISNRVHGDHVLLEVQDSGPGIPSELLPSVFDPSFTTKDSHPGLGLCIARNLCELNNCQLEIRNLQERGVVCCMKLPWPK